MPQRRTAAALVGLAALALLVVVAHAAAGGAPRPDASMDRAARRPAADASEFALRHVRRLPLSTTAAAAAAGALWTVVRGVGDDANATCKNHTLCYPCAADGLCGWNAASSACVALDITNGTANNAGTLYCDLPGCSTMSDKCPAPQSGNMLMIIAIVVGVGVLILAIIALVLMRRRGRARQRLQSVADAPEASALFAATGSPRVYGSVQYDDAENARS